MPIRKDSEHRFCVAPKTGGSLPKGAFAPVTPHKEKRKDWFYETKDCSYQHSGNRKGEKQTGKGGETMPPFAFRLSAKSGAWKARLGGVTAELL